MKYKNIINIQDILLIKSNSKNIIKIIYILKILNINNIFEVLNIIIKSK